MPLKIVEDLNTGVIIDEGCKKKKTAKSTNAKEDKEKEDNKDNK